MGKAGKTETKSAAISAMVTKSLRDRLDALRKRSGKSLADVIEEQLWRGLRLEEEQAAEVQRLFGDPANFAVCRFIGTLMRQLAEQTGRQWIDDSWAHEQVRQGAMAILECYRPQGEPTPPELRNLSPAMLAELGAYIAKLEVNRAELQPRDAAEKALQRKGAKEGA